MWEPSTSASVMIMIRPYLSFSRLNDPAITVANPGADGRYHCLDLLILKHLVQTRLFDIEELSSDRKDRLKSAVTPLFCRATRRISLYNVEFSQGRVPFGAIGEFAGKPSPGQGSFANRLSRLSCGFPRACRHQAFFDDFLGDGGVLLAETAQTFVSDRLGDRLNLVIDQ